MSKLAIATNYADAQAAQRLPQIQAIRDLQDLPTQLAEILAPLVSTADRVDQALTAQRQVIEALATQTQQRISERLAALDRDRRALAAELAQLRDEIDALRASRTSLRRTIERQERLLARCLSLLRWVPAVAAATGAVGSAALLLALGLAL